MILSKEQKTMEVLNENELDPVDQEKKEAKLHLQDYTK